MIIVKLQGGLGNQMFQYALGRALSIQLNTSLKLDLSFLLDRTPTEYQVFRDYELDIFDIAAKFANLNEKNRYICPYTSYPKLAFWKLRRKVMDYKYFQEEKWFTFDARLSKLKGNCYLDGFWQSPKYFEKFKDVILKDFSFNEKIPDQIKKLSDEIISSNSVCLHVRRGDYVSLANANKHHGVTGIDYFNTAISKISETIKDLRIYVFSDDIPWCIENIKSDFLITFVEHEYPNRQLKDYFRLMSLCKHFIISNSSYSWWTAWLNQNPSKIVIAPKQWLNDPNIDTSDLIPDSWIRI
jgi:hypothetical protein